MPTKKTTGNPTKKSVPSKKTSPSTAKKPTPVKSASLQVSKDVTVDVREIENGFLISKSGYIGSGKNARYETKQIFSPTNPIQITMSGTGSSLKLGKKK